MSIATAVAALTIVVGHAQEPATASAPEKNWDALHPALRVDGPTALAIYEKASADAKKARTTDGVWSRVRRGIGSIRVNALGSKTTVSWLWATIPQVVIYEDGFRARKQFRSEEEIKKSKELHGSGAWARLDRIRFDGSIGLYPSFGRTYGRIDRDADPSDLSDVRVVMFVGDKVYQPRKHPGRLEARSGMNANGVAIPQSSTTTVEGTAYGSGGAAYGTATATSYYVTHQTEFYNWYEGVFSVEFDLFNEDGTPRITAKEKQIKIVVIYGANQRGAEYNLADFLKIGK